MSGHMARREGGESVLFDDSFSSTSKLICLLSFFFSFVVAIAHASTLFSPNGRAYLACCTIGIEFFLILWGFLLAERASREQGESIIDATKALVRSQYLQVIPFLIAAVSFDVILISIGRGSSIELFGRNVLLSLPEMCGIQMLGFPGTPSVAGSSWCISALLIISFLMYPLLLKWFKLYVRYLAPLTSLAVYGWLCASDGQLGAPDALVGIVCTGLLRGYAGISCGCAVWELSRVFGNMDSSQFQKLAGIEPLGYLVVLIYAALARMQGTFDFFMVAALAASISITLSGKSSFVLVGSDRLSWMLGRWSIAILLCGSSLAVALPQLLPSFGARKLLLAYAVCVCVQAVFVFFVGQALAKRLLNVPSVVRVLCAIGLLAGIMVWV